MPKPAESITYLEALRANIGKRITEVDALITELRATEPGQDTLAEHLATAGMNGRAANRTAKNISTDLADARRQSDSVAQILTNVSDTIRRVLTDTTY